ncbi:MAG: class I SAM-dependent methyltransferase [Gemmataceae bacterium]|nr:class I SAM-dependent methyltransferase [Gemmataceae bacterium]
MERRYSSKLHVGEGWATTLAQDLLEPEHQRGFAGPHNPSDFAERLYACEALKPAAPRNEDVAEPYSLQWFLDIETQRHSRQGRWIPRLLEFAKHPGETLLGLGHGLGTDWLQYARHGAAVVVCSPSAEQLGLIRRNFELRGLAGRFVQTGFAPLPLENACIDVACVSSLLHEVAQPQEVVDEVYRVLKPGGKVLAVTGARYDVDFWHHLCFPLNRWLLGRRTPRDKQPAPFSGRQLRRLFGRFGEHRVYKRHLRRSEVPHLWRWMPMPMLERMLGRVLVLKAFKPLSTAMESHS